ncbi:hypothetical protein CDL15_Pgr024477 [Punica granatum]|uniref:Uncharacterized protein n=1 Tax=Punica granatum TaxID=22663 RepID=A0A218XYQ6_PUNGR|nr:hypothetical protein CDL15_Pgr024477 [Punica granatum]
MFFRIDSHASRGTRGEYNSFHMVTQGPVKDTLTTRFCGEDVLLWENCSLVPQSQILSHPSTRAFISHWGYSLVFESVIGEVPIICIPQWIDQFTDSRMVEDVWGIGVRVEVRTISKNGMVKCLKMILGDGGGGKKMREKIKAIKEAIMEPVGPNGGASKDFKRAWRS